MIADYAKKTKKKLIDNGLRISLNVSNFNVFKGVGVYPIILLGSNSKQEKSFEEYYLKKYSDITSNTLTPIKKLPEHNTIKDFEMLINAGATGFQAQSLKQHILSNEKENSIPFTVSGNVDRYMYNNTNVKFMKGKYENAYVKFNSDVADSKWNFWCSPKIVIAGMTKEIEAVYVESKLGLGVGIYGIYDFNGFDPYALTGILNSKYLTYYFKNKFKDKHLAGGYLAINKSTIEQFPLVKPSSNCEDVLNKLSKIMHHLKKQETQKEINKSLLVNLFEDVIDAIVFELFFPEDFKDADIKIIKNVTEIFGNFDINFSILNNEDISMLYNIITEKKNPLRNQMKLMKIELKLLLNPILSF